MSINFSNLGKYTFSFIFTLEDHIKKAFLVE